MDKARPFKVVNCISSGFAVAGPSEDEGVDLEFIYWGLPYGKARTKADALNENPELKHKHD